MDNEDSFLRPEGTQAESEGLPDEFLLEIDRELESLQVGSEPVPELVLDQFEGSMDGLSEDPGIRQMQITFIEIACDKLGPVKRYMKALSTGEYFRELLEMSEMVVTPLLNKTEEVWLSKHADDLMFFRSLIQLALGERDQVGMEAMREVVMEGFSKLSERFGLRYRGYRLAVRNLVQFYKKMRQENIPEIEIRKFFAVGVPSLTWVRRTRASELSSLSGIPADVVFQIRKLAAEYKAVSPMSSASLAREDFLLPPLEAEELDPEIGEADVLESAVLSPEVKSPPRGQA